MERQAGFSIFLLFLANSLTIEADTITDRVNYIGHTHPIAGKSWFITCEDLDQGDLDRVMWTRDGVSLQPDIESNELTVHTTKTSSTLSASAAKPSHQGEYKCTSASSFSHYLQVHSALPLSDETTMTLGVTRNIDENLRVLEPHRNLTLVCLTISTAPVYWKLGKTDLPDNKKHFERMDNGRVLVISNPVESILGNYTCRHNKSAMDFLSFYRVIGVPPVKLLGNSYIVEGGKLELVCSTSANLGPKITWVFGNYKYSNSKNRVKLTRDNAEITVENISMTDSGPIHCQVSFNNIVDGAVKAEGSIKLVVKEKDAALWPFLGTCIQLIALYAIIRIHKKKGNKTEVCESDTDQSPEK